MWIEIPQIVVCLHPSSCWDFRKASVLTRQTKKVWWRANPWLCLILCCEILLKCQAWPIRPWYNPGALNALLRAKMAFECRNYSLHVCQMICKKTGENPFIPGSKWLQCETVAVRGWTDLGNKKPLSLMILIWISTHFIRLKWQAHLEVTVAA